MKKHAKISILNLIIIALFFITLTNSCNKDSDEPSKQPDVESISPESGVKNTLVTINGSDFGTNLAATHVFFNGKEATVLSVTNSKIETSVPTRAFTGIVTVNIGGLELNAGNFTYLLSDVYVNTYAGSSVGLHNANGIEAKFSGPNDMVIDNNGIIYVADSSNHVIRRIDTDGNVTTFAGSSQGFSDGAPTVARFDSPRGIAVDNQGNVFVADTGNNSIRKISQAGIVSTFAGSTGSSGFVDGNAFTAKFDLPSSLVLDNQGNVFVADSNNNRIRKISPSGDVTTFAGSSLGYTDGNGVNALFNSPYGIDIDINGNLYVADLANQSIRQISTTGDVTTIAGSNISGDEDGESSSAKFNFPIDVAVDEVGNVFVADLFNHKLRRVSPDGYVTTIAGNTFGFADGLGSNAKFRNIAGVCTGENGLILIADRSNNKIRKIIFE